MSGPYIANARMYAVAPGAAAAWKALFAWLAHESGIDLQAIDHAFPATLDDLWDRDDLGAAFMCGWPYARRAEKPKLVAAPIPAAARYGGKPVYFTDLVVRADSPFQTLPHTFGHRLAYTATGSHSGFNAQRYHLASRHGAQKHYGSWLGPYTTPRRIVEAVLAGQVDVGPLDSFAHDLMRRHEPELMAGVRAIESTDAAPMPSLVASRATPHEIVARLRAALLSVGDRLELAGLRDSLCVSGFGLTRESDYQITLDRAAAAEAAGYAGPE
jgi:ABC-type phosphate/phosphonate transport system substrate-binding protein